MSPGPVPAVPVMGGGAAATATAANGNGNNTKTGINVAPDTGMTTNPAVGATSGLVQTGGTMMVKGANDVVTTTNNAGAMRQPSMTNTPGDKVYTLSRDLLEQYVQERMRRERMRLMSCLTIELKRMVENQLATADAMRSNANILSPNGEPNLRLEFRPQVDWNKLEFSCQNPECRFCMYKGSRRKQEMCQPVAVEGGVGTGAAPSSAPRGATAAASGSGHGGDNTQDNRHLRQSFYIKRQRGKGFDGAVLEDKWGYPLQVVLVNAQGKVVHNSPEIRIELTLLKGDFDTPKWSTHDFEQNEHHASTGSGELLKGQKFSMKHGQALVPDTFYILQPSYNFKPRTFRLGARATNMQGVVEARSEPFSVKTGRSLSDEKKRAADVHTEDVAELPVKKLPGIGRAARDKLETMSIVTVQDFVRKMGEHGDSLRKTLKMSDRQWEEAAAAAKRLVVEAAPPRVWFRTDDRDVGIMFDSENYPVALILPDEGAGRGSAAGSAGKSGKPTPTPTNKHRMVSLLEGELNAEQRDLLVEMQKMAYNDWFQDGHPRWEAMPKASAQSLETLTAEGGGRKEVTKVAHETALTALRSYSTLHGHGQQALSDSSSLNPSNDSAGANAMAGGFGQGSQGVPSQPNFGGPPQTTSFMQRGLSMETNYLMDFLNVAGGTDNVGVSEDAAGLLADAARQGSHMAIRQYMENGGNEETLLDSFLPGMTGDLRQTSLLALRQSSMQAAMPIHADHHQTQGQGLGGGGGGRGASGMMGRGSGGSGMSLGLGAALKRDKERGPQSIPMSTGSPPGMLPPASMSGMQHRLNLKQTNPVIPDVRQDSWLGAFPGQLVDVGMRQNSMDIFMHGRNSMPGFQDPLPDLEDSGLVSASGGSNANNGQGDLVNFVRQNSKNPDIQRNVSDSMGTLARTHLEYLTAAHKSAQQNQDQKTKPLQQQQQQQQQTQRVSTRVATRQDSTGQRPAKQARR